MAESQIGITNGKGLNRRLDSQALIAQDVATWKDTRDAQEACIHWTLALAFAQQHTKGSPRQMKFDGQPQFSEPNFSGPSVPFLVVQPRERPPVRLTAVGQGQGVR